MSQTVRVARYTMDMNVNKQLLQSAISSNNIFYYGIVKILDATSL